MLDVHFYETKWSGAGRAWEVASFCSLGGGGAPDGDRKEVFEDMAFFGVVVFGAGEGVVFGRYAIREIEDAADLLGRVDGALGFMQYGGV